MLRNINLSIKEERKQKLNNNLIMQNRRNYSGAKCAIRNGTNSMNPQYNDKSDHYYRNYHKKKLVRWLRMKNRSYL